MSAHAYRATLRFLVRLFCKSDQISLPIIDTPHPPDMIYSVFNIRHVCVHVCMYIHTYVYTHMQPYSTGISPIPHESFLCTVFIYFLQLHISMRTQFSTDFFFLEVCGEFFRNMYVHISLHICICIYIPIHVHTYMTSASLHGYRRLSRRSRHAGRHR